MVHLQITHLKMKLKSCTPKDLNMKVMDTSKITYLTV